MNFAERYIRKNLVYPTFIKTKPNQLLKTILVVPVFNEPQLCKMLESVAACEVPTRKVEVLLVVNCGENAPEEVILQNKKTVEEVECWIESNLPFFDVYILQPLPFIKKHAGAGMARKIGMDEAVRRFSELEKPDGIIVSLDADTFVARNYLMEIEHYFSANPKSVGACIDFKHRIDELTDERQKEGMRLYEKYLHYYRDAMAFTGFPYAIHTVGSAFAVKVEAYVRQGGMNRKQAGEDFYFLHKLSQLGKIGELKSTCVYPSARISERVPFGTGPVLKKWMAGDDDLKSSYRFQAFIDLKKLFDRLQWLFDCSVGEAQKAENNLPLPVRSFLKEDGFWEALEEVKQNSSRFETFYKRFFHYFNAFKILKYLNYSHHSFFFRQNLEEAENELHNHRNML